MNKELNTCLACGSKNLEVTLNLGKQPLANSYKKNKNDPEDRFELACNVCRDCFHLQLSEAVDPKLLFENYLYVSGTSKTLKDYCDWFAGCTDQLINRNSYNILDIGCNDGTQLNSFKDLGYNTYGIDPAKNLYHLSSKNHNVICDYFSPEILKVFNTELDAIIAQNVMAHNYDPFTFLNTCKHLMGEDTYLFVQTSQADMVINNEFDTIYHEHINFFNINSMNELARRVGLNLIDVFKTPIHGNSYVFVFHKNINKSYYIANLISMEAALLNHKTYRKWVNNVHANMQVLKDAILAYKDKGYKLIGYGAAAKGNTLLNFTDIKLDYIIDDNPLKQNLFCPGSSIEIKSIDLLNEYNEDDKILFLPLAWNFFTEICNRIKTKRDNKNDIFLKYFPKVEVSNV